MARTPIVSVTAVAIKKLRIELPPLPHLSYPEDHQRDEYAKGDKSVVHLSSFQGRIPMVGFIFGFILGIPFNIF